jgi:hypothetical protein
VLIDWASCLLDVLFVISHTRVQVGFCLLAYLLVCYVSKEVSSKVSTSKSGFELNLRLSCVELCSKRRARQAVVDDVVGN